MSGVDSQQISDWLLARKQLCCHRQLVVISGSPAFCKQQLLPFVSHFSTEPVLALGHSQVSVPGALPLKQATQLLGQSCKLGIYDAFEAFRPSALLSLAGTVADNGILILCVPPTAEWSSYTEHTTNHYLSYGQTCENSIFRAYMAQLFCSRQDIALIEAGGICRLPRPQPVAQNPSLLAPAPFASLDQQQAFEQLSHVSESGICVLTADRGRGKSTLLGMLAAHWLQFGKSVTICSRFPDSINAIFEGVKRIAPNIPEEPARHIQLGEHCLRWLPVDHPELYKDTQAVLIIDEAANLPIPTLQSLCLHYKRVVLSTTMRGYEGTGRGFLTRFIPWLKQQTQTYESVSLFTPCRWAPDDPVEDTLYRALQLEYEPSQCGSVSLPTSKTGKNPVNVEYNFLSAESPESFNKVLSLLMTAHYQTTVDELIRLCDSPENYTLVATHQDDVMGVINIQIEGGTILQPVANDIASGTRRVNGHLSAQALSLYLADPAMATQRYCRINRIAVSEAYRRKGIATKLIHALIHWLNEQSIDALTTSFGATESLMRFWQSCGFEAVKAGLKRDASSAEYSLLMWKPITAKSHGKRNLVAQRFYQELSVHPVPGIFNTMVNQNEVTEIGLAPEDDDFVACNTEILKQVISGLRQIQHARGSLIWLLARCNPKTSKMDNETTKSIDVLNKFVACFDDLFPFIKQYNLTGKKQAYDFATKQLTQLVSHI
ncbi:MULTISPECIES: GNAT family N-acetyltransferase [Marisediminitalea]|jgi:tRNA(Met) cytidine acetyltransferase|uniref:GNAT family N-acetyltransferase n=1 Tax=Marisediminitalea TaxID=2662254 RepID=UPI0020CC3F3A|nr:GNAT family N-acetyltransferase [Marisediminitalea aggregata]MCP3862252.1 tRNA(Met) cytidine acetyltransferase [Aestuariibacter sp.]MCP4236191.1 tRNA(Met) cytidine acetyltransferase [Aestuariibacter sp.]MCP4526918.1 tRNA(Met) cytidine acetyltransferase [Aestuariibacter sp.]MCP9479561.1 GNAT family N-acetyltransferase [Marisediminitalea aggregata]|tara:strand:+ start:3863 stop:6013 length:2151 start_codon:yes stop_codon:yes gene_type:complete